MDVDVTLRARRIARRCPTAVIPFPPFYVHGAAYGTRQPDSPSSPCQYIIAKLHPVHLITLTHPFLTSLRPFTPLSAPAPAAMAGMKNLALMGGTMMLVKRLDQEAADVILYTRAAFAAYLFICCVINMYLHARVVAAGDRSPLVVPPPAPSPFTPPPPPDAPPPPPPTDTHTTVLAYDLGILQTARRSWLMNAVVLTLIHAKTGAINPLIMSSVMGLVKLVDDPLFRLHVLREPATGSLKRPFTPEANPLATLMQGLAPKPEGEDGAADAPPAADGAVGYAGRANGAVAGAGTNGNGMRRRAVPAMAEPVEVEELHSDGEEEEEDEEPKPLAADEDRADDDDFCDEPTEDKKGK